jgi:hypothetical protein
MDSVFIGVCRICSGLKSQYRETHGFAAVNANLVCLITVLC